MPSSNQQVNILYGTQLSYNNLDSTSEDTLYFTDENRLYLGAELISGEIQNITYDDSSNSLLITKKGNTQIEVSLSAEIDWDNLTNVLSVSGEEKVLISNDDYVTIDQIAKYGGKIVYISQEDYDSLVDNDELDPDVYYVTPDGDTSIIATKDYVDESLSNVEMSWKVL